MLCHIKVSDGPEQDTLIYHIEQNAGIRKLVWVGVSDLTKGDLGASKPTKGFRSRDVANIFLNAMLSSGPRLSTEVAELAHLSGITPKTLERARCGLHVETQQIRNGSTNAWVMFFPKDKDRLQDVWRSGGLGQNPNTEIAEKLDNLSKAFINLSQKFDGLRSGGLGSPKPQDAKLWSEDNCHFTPLPRQVLRAEVEQGIAYVKSLPALDKAVTAPTDLGCEYEMGSWVEHLSLPWLKTVGAEEALKDLDPPATMKLWIKVEEDEDGR